MLNVNFEAMNIKEQIEEILLTDFGCFDEYTVEKLLNLHSVSQQSELLAFRKWQKDNWKDVYLYSDEFMISEFKKANCG